VSSSDAAPVETHAIRNQPPEFGPCDLWSTDSALREAVVRQGGGAFVAHLGGYGRIAGDDLYRLS
jgi:putative acyl-CoA dehydrogenase